MALVRFKAPPLPNPPDEYEPQFFRQLVRTLELYFSQLDSATPNRAQSYTADAFYGGELSGYFQNVTTAEKTALTAVQGQVVFDSTLQKLCVFTDPAWETITSV